MEIGCRCNRQCYSPSNNAISGLNRNCLEYMRGNGISKEKKFYLLECGHFNNVNVCLFIWNSSENVESTSPRGGTFWRGREQVLIDSEVRLCSISKTFSHKSNCVYLPFWITDMVRWSMTFNDLCFVQIQWVILESCAKRERRWNSNASEPAD